MTRKRLEKQSKVLEQAKIEVSAAPKDKKLELMRQWNNEYYKARVPLTEVNGFDREWSAGMTLEWSEFCVDVAKILKGD